ncbi:cytochrome p450 6a1 [Diplogelasinospora grovesii]|uniref:Cytochrome p450 6a1 n=1 Tax=Diplogelasinospora grovesii TaxID=303347 RepID=A0AAN6N815_9PEZI|nr:cytochrome p450 6a1 [Diplogelasinospora grovesii]
MDALTNVQNWPATIWILLATAVITVTVNLLRRPAWPKSSPTLFKQGGGALPILGALRFFSDRRNFMVHGTQASRSGNFGFYFGKLQVVGMAGVEGRKTFFESRDLNLSEGYNVLFTTTPNPPSSVDEGGEDMKFDKFFSRALLAMLKRENFVRNLPTLVGDARAGLERAMTKHGVMDPFDDVYRIVYHLTMRTVGCTEIAESPEMLAKTLRLFEVMEESSSPTQVIFPYLWTPNYLRKMLAGGRLYYMLDAIVKGRKKTGRREEDALQFLIDSGESMVRILSFVLGALFAGQLNSGINAAWMFIYLAATPDWYRIVQREVDEAVEKHRKSEEQSPTDVLGTLTIDDWEHDFPMIDLVLRECIRFQMVGTTFRQNVSGKDVPIGKTGEVVPKDAFAVYLMDDVHFNPEIYPDPNRWDPGRYLPDRAEDKKQPHAYLGWGVARHPCLGMRFAKLEMSIIGATFVSMFDYELQDAKGNPMKTPPLPDRNRHSAHKPKTQMRLKYKLRA